MMDFENSARDLRLTRRRFLCALTGGIGAAALLAPVGGGRGALAAAPVLSLTTEQKQDLKRVEAYLNDIRTLQARFQQSSPKAGFAWGRIFLRRPGRMRVEYDPPVPVVLVADGIAVSHYDSELDQLSQVPLSSTPAWFLLRDPIRLDEDLIVTRLDKRAGALRLGMYQADDPDAGTVTLIFSDGPLELKNWTIVDAAGNEVTIALFDAQLGGELDNKLFATPVTRRRRGTSGKS